MPLDEKKSRIKNKLKKHPNSKNKNSKMPWQNFTAVCTPWEVWIFRRTISHLTRPHQDRPHRDRLHLLRLRCDDVTRSDLVFHPLGRLVIRGDDADFDGIDSDRYVLAKALRFRRLLETPAVPRYR